MTQRAGRAGRLEPGICLHLIGKEQAERAAAQSDPEILHSDLSALLLELYSGDAAIRRSCTGSIYRLRQTWQRPDAC